MKFRRLFVLFLALLVSGVAPYATVRAQGEPQSPYYVVQPGDTLSAIAYRFGVDIHALAKANDITNLAHLQAGQKLVIPGVEGVQGELTTRPVVFGDTLMGLSRALNIPEATLARLNRVLTPCQVFAGRSFILPAAAAQRKVLPRRMLLGQRSLLEAALAHHTSPWALAVANRLLGTWAALPGDVLILPDTSAGTAATGLPDGLQAVISPHAWVQGHTGEVRLSAPTQSLIKGVFGKHTLHFFPLKDGHFVALQGVFALADPGLYPLRLDMTLPDGRAFHFQQTVPVVRGKYASERLIVPAALLDPALNTKEEQRFAELTTPATPVRYWHGIFKAPVAPPLDKCHPSYFGTRRNYNDTFFWYHTGLDFCGRVGTPIYAPAAGVVIFTGTTEIHGKVTIIDHGWGVYTTYCHQSAILVKKGQTVHTGDLIGKVGRTGRVTGPHLHWEVWVGDVPVEPLEWLTKVFP